MDKHAFAPDYVVLPGKTLAETLSAAEMTQAHLAERTGLSRKTINGIINGSEPITPDTAIQLEKVFRVPVSFWLNLQKQYEEHAARLRERARLTDHADWLDEMEIPVKELVARGAILEYKNKSDIFAVLKFFGWQVPRSSNLCGRAPTRRADTASPIRLIFALALLLLGFVWVNSKRRPYRALLLIGSACVPALERYGHWFLMIFQRVWPAFTNCWPHVA